MGAMTIPAFARPLHREGGRVGVLFCHGFTSTPQSMRPWAEAVADAGYTVSVPRLPGHGTVWQELAVTSWQDWYRCVDDEYRELTTRCDQVVVAGMSMGGSLAMRLAEQHPDVAGLALVNPALGAVDWRTPLAGLIKHVVQTTAAVGSDIAQPAATEVTYEVTPVAAAHQLLKLWADVRSCLDLITCPVIVFRSRIDHVVPASSTESLLRLASSEDITEVVLDRSYHVATLDYDAPIIIEDTLEFLQRVTAGPGR